MFYEINRDFPAVAGPRQRREKRNYQPEADEPLAQEMKKSLNNLSAK